MTGFPRERRLSFCERYRLTPIAIHSDISNFCKVNLTMHSHCNFSRRQFIAGASCLSGLALTGCALPGRRIDPPEPGLPKSYLQMYGPMPNERFALPAVDLKKVSSKYYRRQVNYVSPEPTGTIIVDTKNFYLYLVGGGDRAMRYGVGLGRAGFEWAGRARIGWKQEWPKWTPPDLWWRRSTGAK